LCENATTFLSFYTYCCHNEINNIKGVKSMEVLKKTIIIILLAASGGLVIAYTILSVLSVVNAV
jgi:hypothetical protein